MSGSKNMLGYFFSAQRVEKRAKNRIKILILAKVMIF